jgi:hypothetical protein
MAETLSEYDKWVPAPDGTDYKARACGGPLSGGTWQCWIEFVQVGDGTRVRTGRETIQPNRFDSVNWAIGVSAMYLEAALRRALSGPRVMPVPPPRPALFYGPAPNPALPGDDAPMPCAVLDPFSVYQEGEVQLRRRLMPLSPRQLANIAVAYEMTALDSGVLDCLPAATLLELIVLGVLRGSVRRASRGKRSITSPTPARVAPSNTTQSDQ